MKRKDRRLLLLDDPPSELAIAVLAEHLIKNCDDPLVVIAEASGLPVKQLLERYLPTVLN